MDIQNIIVAGDSIARGHADAQGYYSWPAMLLPRLARKLGTNVGLANLSVGGLPSPQIVERFRTALPTVDFLSAIIFAFGANDVRHLGKDRNAPFFVSPDQWESTWRSAFACAVQLRPEVPVFAVSVMPVDDTFYNAADFSGAYRSSQDVDDYNSALEVTCRTMGVNFINASQAIDRATWVRSLIDGVHPDKEGHVMLTEQVYQNIERVL